MPFVDTLPADHEAAGKRTEEYFHHRVADVHLTQNPFKWRHDEADIILLCGRWYLRYSLSYRDLEEMMQERGLHVDHTTIYCWVQRYAPKLEKRSRPHLNTTLLSGHWRMRLCTYIN